MGPSAKLDGSQMDMGANFVHFAPFIGATSIAGCRFLFQPLEFFTFLLCLYSCNLIHILSIAVEIYGPSLFPVPFCNLCLSALRVQSFPKCVKILDINTVIAGIHGP